MNELTRRYRLRFLLIASVIMSACATKDEPMIGGFRPPVASEGAGKGGAQGQADGATLQLGEATPDGTGRERIREGQIPGAPAPTPSAASEAGPAPAGAAIRPTRVAFDRAPLPVFINAVFAETLKFSVRLDPALSARTETVTLKTGDPVSGTDLFDIAAAALKDYGVEVIVESPRTLRFTTVDRQRGGTPQVFRGGSISRDANIGDSPIYYHYTIRSSNINSLVTLLGTTFAQKVQVTGSPSENALLLSGSAATITAALELLDSFDQPRMAGKPVVTVEPVYYTPTKMADALARVLRTAGYGVSTSPDAAAINILPLDEVGVVLIFAADEKLRRFAVDWARQMDEPRQVAGDGQAFMYFVKNTDASSVADVIATVLGSGPTSGGGGRGVETANSTRSLSGDPMARGNTNTPAPAPAAAGAATAVQAGGMRIAVDPARNALIIMGKAEQYASILPLLRQIDRSPGEVLIEVVLAEITLTDRTSLGVQFELGNRLRSGDVPIRGGTQGLGVGASGLALRLLDPASSAQVFINTISTRNRVNILSNPRIVAKSGSAAHIQVGTQVPVLRQQSSNPQFGQAGVTNQVDYIDTGVVLNVRPVIRADRRVDLEIAQEVSEAQSNNTSDISSPLIFTRSLSTSLSLQDGQTVLLGGLKSQNRSNGRTGVPGLSRIPGVGAAFQNQSAGKTDTELLVFITPYVVSEQAASDAVVARYRDSMRRWPKVSGGLQW
jgi:general secretion pathway protein D